jgi:hypothetical protein
MPASTLWESDSCASPADLAAAIESSPLFDAYARTRDAERLEQPGHLLDERRRPAHETERLCVVNERREIGLTDSASRARPVFGTDLACDGLFELDPPVPRQRAQLFFIREFARRPCAVKHADLAMAAAQMKTKRCSSGFSGNVNRPNGPSISTSARGSSVRCGPALPSASTPTSSSRQSSRSTSSGADAIEYGRRRSCPCDASSSAWPG